MEETITPDPEFVTGYNQGYTIAQHLPDLAEKLSKAVNDTPHGQGFKSGREQYQKEAKDSRRPSWLKQDRFTDMDKDDAKDMGRDMDSR